MPMLDKYLNIPLTEIEVPRNERQRRAVDVSGLLDSVKHRGVITPIIVEESGIGKYLLIAGERRLTASRQLGLQTIPARLASSLSSSERLIIELEENIKRSDLEWKDFCLAVKRIHVLYIELDSAWTQAKTAESISVEPGTLSIILRVAEELSLGNELIQQAPHYRGAYNIIARKDSRKIDDVFNVLMGGDHDDEVVEEKEPVRSTTSTPSPDRLVTPPQRRDSITCGDFIQWATTYRGPLFSFIHCDFPYGIRLDKSDQGNTASWGGYEDTAEVYWKLCQCLSDNLDHLMAPSAHLMFWLSSDFTIIHKTLQFFSIHAPSLDFNPKLLIWYKSDGKGILPDPNRGPRHVYESALFASRGDRLVSQSVADCYSSPKGNTIHQSEKPEPVLRHFFRMFCDAGTSMLDPTAGSGTSLCAAEALGAKVSGLEINPEWAKDAEARLRSSRSVRLLEAEVL